MTTETGGPAFPHEYEYGDGTAQRCDGMTLRDYFAAKAMGALLVESSWQGNTTGTVAGIAYDMADAMLKARSK